MNAESDSLDEAVLNCANDVNKTFLTSSRNPDGLFVISTSTDGNISPNSDGNPAASPPIVLATKATESPRHSHKNRRSNSDIPNAIFSNNSNGASPTQQWAAPPPPPGMYRQQHSQEMMSSSWSGSHGLSPYHLAMMGKIHYNNEAAHPAFLSHPPHSQNPLTYPNDDQKSSIGTRNEPRTLHSFNNSGQHHTYPYPQHHHNNVVNSNMYQMPPPGQQTPWQTYMEPPTGPMSTMSRMTSSKPPFSQRPPSANDYPRQEKRGHRKSLSSSAAAVPIDYGSSWNRGQNYSLESFDNSNHHVQTFPHPLRNHNESTGIPNMHQKSNTSRILQTGGSLGRNQAIRFKLDNNIPTSGNLNKSQKFSPRNDLRKMFRDLSPVQSQRKENGFSAGVNTNQSFRSGSPNPYNAASLRSPSSRKLMNGVAGEAAGIFKGVPSRESNRKKHQRQLSAQQYMEQIKGVEQPLQCRNVSFLLLFLCHFLFVGAYLGERYVKESFSPSNVPAVNPEIIRIDYQVLMLVSILSGGFAIILSSVLLALMTIFARNYLQISLFITVGMAFIWGTLGVGLSPKTIVPVTGIIALGFAVAYTFIVWDRLPFHSINLLSALSGIKVFPTTVVLANFMQIVSLVWIVYFSVIAAGFYNAVQENKVPFSKPVIGVCYFLFVISYFWTYQVIQGCVKAATAGVIAGWWHTPNYSDQVRDSCFKTMFYSIGSICLGGLLIGPVAVLRQLSILVRPSQSEPSLLCLHECLHFMQTCIFNAVDFLAVRCNDYSYAYVGMYHYSFLEGGFKATDLFEKRGWTTIVSDDLVQNVLLLTSLAMGGMTGCFAHSIALAYSISITPLQGGGMSSFAVGTVIGLVLGNIVFSVVSSAVNTVLICFAGSPMEFETNHPVLSSEMRQAWREVWPDALDVQYPIPNLPSQQTDSDEAHPLL